jgi:subtilisin family serine protease
MKKCARAAAASFFVLIAAMPMPRAGAQVGPPPVRMPQLPVPLTGPLTPAGNPFSSIVGDAQGSVRGATTQRLIRSNPKLLEADPNGQPMLRGELVALDLTAAELDRIVAAGFSVGAGQALAGLDAELYVLRAQPALSTLRALQRLRELDPGASFDFDHLYLQSALPATGEASAARPAIAAAAGHAMDGVRVGLIDSGVQRTHAVFARAIVTSWGCQGESIPSSHGTEVASLLVGDSAPFRGAAPGAALYAADVYCGAPAGGAIETIAQAFGWLSGQHVPVINVSLVGPDNVILKRVVQQTIAQGCLIVAAVGNDGPAAPPLYPAAYPNVIGVSAVDGRHRVLLEAERGPQVSFAAPGADLAAASLPDGYQAVRGTSFAAPIVAGLLAQRLLDPQPDAARRAVESLAREAEADGHGKRDQAAVGFGLVGLDVAILPARLQARAVPSP